LCEIVACPKALAIISPRTKKFQGGDDVFYALIVVIGGKLQDLEADLLASIAELRTVLVGGKQRVDSTGTCSTGLYSVFHTYMFTIGAGSN
jgi:hypothetical protein